MPHGDCYPGRCRHDRSPKRRPPVPMLADLIDAVVGVDTHRDTHHVEIALPTGTPIATCSITNDASGYAQLLAAHLAVLSALRLDTSQLPIPRADGDREALRILLGARHDLTVTSTAQINRLRALLRDAH